MKDIKILVILVIVVGVLYWGVEPLAHSVFHPEKAKADFAFSDLERIDLSKGDKERGKDLVETNCVACHSVNGVGERAEMGVVAPDLSTAGAIYNENFLAALIKDPERAMHLEHKFKGSHPMPPYFAMGDDADSEIADIVAYLKSIGEASLKMAVNYSEEFADGKEKIEKLGLSDSQTQEQIEKLRNQLTNKQVFLDACSRCHSIKYDEPKTHEQLVVNSKKAKNIAEYMGATAPDLSMVIRSKGAHYLENFINDPQRVAFADINKAILNQLEKEGKPAVLPENTMRDSWQDERDYSNLAREMGVMPVGLSMPRVGLNEESQERVIAYLESIGDSKKEERENLGWWIIGFFAVLSFVAFLWKQAVWRDLH